MQLSLTWTASQFIEGYYSNIRVMVISTLNKMWKVAGINYFYYSELVHHTSSVILSKLSYIYLFFLILFFPGLDVFNWIISEHLSPG